MASAMARIHESSKGKRPERKVRILIGKPGLDGHDRGAKIIARALRDAGFEIIYTGLSILSGAHNHLLPRIVEMLREKKMGDVVVFGGGIIPDGDIAKLKKKGVDRVFTPGTTLREIVDYVRGRVKPRK
jgi:methylmalonyl-CoA mutase C-terminal domain/subunit